MISEQEIRATAKRNGVAPRVIEKDYHLGLLLREIGKDKQTQGFIFKGGTALKKCYFKEYRFSEDIDFTVTNRALNNQEKLSVIMRRWCSNSNEELGTTFRLFNIVLERETYGQESFKATIHYDGIEGAAEINVDLTFYENVELVPRTKQIKHPYSDKTDFGKASLKVYCLEETIAEKLRAVSFIQHYPRNRDIYDIWYLTNTADLDKKQIASLYLKKCKHKGIDSAHLKNVNSSYMDRFQKSWYVQLGHQIKDLPEFDMVKRDFIKFAETIRLLIRQNNN